MFLDLGNKRATDKLATRAENPTGQRGDFDSRRDSVCYAATGDTRHFYFATSWLFL